MTRVYFSKELDTVATYWRVERKDGVALGFTSHDRDLVFDGLLFRSAPGMVPSAIRLTANLDLDSAEVRGALSHDTITPQDLAAGRYDFARVEIGLVDWEVLEWSSLYAGQIGSISADGLTFESDLRSVKAQLQRDLVPRTSPTCRALFCGPGCGLSAHRFSYEAAVASVDHSKNVVLFDSGPEPEKLLEGSVRWIGGPHAGVGMEVLDADESGILLDTDLSPNLEPGNRAILREGCDHTLATCDSRFANAVNFRGEPFLPGNDALVRYPTSSS